ncbi:MULTISPECIES: polysaccharide deacetylase family protein [Gracilibacillus]|uniref:polysaccharide deacetylase family protein n=1 Tax=Gracilibacillus TaxID=74385 RepID=UPI000AA3615F|nr:MULTISPECIES: polysaccharide deacetylase family protein [Gracilibacillus]
MIKKYIVFILACSMLLLAACNSEDADGNTQSNEDAEDTTEDATESEGDNSEEDPDQTGDETDGANETDEKTDNTDDQSSEETDNQTDQVGDPEAEKQYELDTSTWSLTPIEDGTNEKVVLLTIDDVPDENGLEMAKTLKELDAPAIFYVNGHFIESEEDQEALREIHDMGFAIGNHTYNHQQLSVADEETQKQEIMELDEKIEEVIGERPEFFRAPHGDNTDYAKQVVKDEGMLLMNWTYGYDYFEPYMDEDKIREAMISGEAPEIDIDYSLLKPGAILLMHDREWTAAALADIVEGLREQGYEIADPNTIEIPE